MELEISNNEIDLNKVLSVYDTFVIDFLKLLKQLDIKYVIISGYVILLFGRQRVTEDIDIFLEELDEQKLKNLFAMLQKEYWIINAGSYETFKDLYRESMAWRVAKKDTITPNMEIKRAKTYLDSLSLNNSIKVILNKEYEIRISPIELQIAYKLFLGSKNDLEDASYLYDLFKGKLDKEKLLRYIKELKVPDDNKILVLI